MIEIKNLKFSYGASTILDNISLRLKEGSIYGLLGENGVGKTTLLTLVAGLKKPQEGTIVIDGSIPSRREPSLLRNSFILLDEVPAFNETAEKFAEETGSFWPEFSMEGFQEIMACLDNDPKKKMNHMSAGQLKKTHICLALACRPKYLLMDEPTNGLDIPSKVQFRSAIMKYTREDSTIIISTHQVRDLENIIDPIIIMDKKEILLDATVAEISEKLFFDYGSQLNPGSLFTEQLPGGFIQVYPNTDGQESKVDIEALFGCVHKNKEAIRGMFSK